VQLSATPPVVSYPEQYPFLFDGPVFIHHGGGGGGGHR
jgi:hypothetical protein